MSSIAIRILLAATALTPALVVPMAPVVARNVPAAAPVAGIEAWLAKPEAERSLNDPALARPLNRTDADRALALLGAERMRAVSASAAEAVAAKQITIGDKTLKWESKTFGNAAPGKRSLWISMHGGGNAEPAVNDQQWRNQIRLYEPAEGIYLAPRAPTDTWNLWHEGHIDPLFQQLIDAQVAINGVDPNRVYLMGYSAGGDGVWQLAPRMADRFAAAAMMAGHPNESSVLGLRNLPFAIFMGGADAAYDRNKIAADKTAELDRMHAADPAGYVHMSRIYPGLPHWMNRKDAEALPWMAGFTRDPWPKRIVWLQDDVTHDRFYWLHIPDAAAAKAGDTITASVEGQTITLTGAVPAGTTLRLSDHLLNLDRPVKVIVNGRTAYSGKVARTGLAIEQSIRERADLTSAATAVLKLG
ncbi:dienelactone hydrolase family protein [Sphingomonas sp. NIBR02145]|uniref:dienelactone hydrolase family protein n=1 Tax=Sphingomonas sp. NIBR02145 TaxID=3014784 RepID=UPI0022B44EF8|nr:dienelactone hydrolase family protein [Sphingomonas sp. NIBR02145]WHU02788.1 dienelactone hydrolase family protein [Sphingomonas sp. NIBR02145]